MEPSKRPRLSVRIGDPEAKRRRRSGTSSAASAPSSAAAPRPDAKSAAEQTDKVDKATEAGLDDVDFIVSVRDPPHGFPLCSNPSGLKSTVLCRPRRWRKTVVLTTNVFGEEVETVQWVSAMAPMARRPPDSEFESNQRTRATFRCTIKHCMKAFLSQTSLDRHLRFHDQRQFVCSHPGCGKSFGDSSKLKRHMLVHTGERRFLCPVPGCGKRFSLDFNLRTHLRVHESHERKRQQREEETRKRMEDIVAQQLQLQEQQPQPQPQRAAYLQPSAAAAAPAPGMLPHATPHAVAAFAGSGGQAAVSGNGM